MSCDAARGGQECHQQQRYHEEEGYEFQSGEAEFVPPVVPRRLPSQQAGNPRERWMRGIAGARRRSGRSTGGCGEARRRDAISSFGLRRYASRLQSMGHAYHPFWQTRHRSPP